MQKAFSAKCFFTLLLVAYSFVTSVEGAPLCNVGQLNETTINEDFVNIINEYRSTAAKGQQINGPSGNLPSAQNMNQISWDCELEATSITILDNKCSDLAPTSYSGKCGISIAYDDGGERLGYFLELVLEMINTFALNDVSDDVKYTGEVFLQEYVNFINAKVTSIGCTFARCVENGDNMITVLCVTDQECLQSGDVIYETAKSTTSSAITTYAATSTSDATTATSDATEGTISTKSTAAESTTAALMATTMTSSEDDASSKFTATEFTAVTSTRVSLTTGLPTTVHLPATEISYNVTATNILSTEATIFSTVAISTFNTRTAMSSTEATTEEPNTLCPNNVGMIDSLRIAILAKHNELRSALALGAVPNGKTNNTCRKASKMPTLVYCCELEKTAIERASLCEQMDSVPQGNLIENNYNFTKNLNRTLATAANNAAQLWWSEITKLESGIDQIQNLYYTHLGINSFAKMASDLTTGVGCAVVHCGNRINVVCHYDTTLANAVKLYTCGPTCNRCENGTSSCVNGLCPAASETCSVATTTAAPEATTTTTEPNTLCPNNHGMTDPLRFAILAKHNSLRTALALGTVENGQTGVMCRKASKMPTLTYSCNLECTALARASKCSQMDSTPPQCISENSYNFTKNLNRTLSQAANAATQVWWSELAALESGIDQIQNLFYTHLGISSFAKIASDLTTKIGCAVVHCNDLINVVCHYQTNLTNAVKLYTAGPTCKKCENGTDSCVNALCPASSE